jgi:hypothetical protein
MDFYLDSSVFFGRLRKNFSKDCRRLEEQKSKVMKFHQILLGVTVGLAACSTPKYTYHFDHYDYNSGRKNVQPAVELKTEANPLEIDETTLVVSSNPQPVVIAEEKESRAGSMNAIAEKYNSLSKTEQKAFKKELRKELKNFAKNTARKKADGVESVNATQKFDTLVTLAIVFGAAGIVLITLAGISNAFWIVGAVSLAIGCFFFVKWVANGNG